MFVTGGQISEREAKFPRKFGPGGPYFGGTIFWGGQISWDTGSYEQPLKVILISKKKSVIYAFYQYFRHYNLAYVQLKRHSNYKNIVDF